MIRIFLIFIIVTSIVSSCRKWPQNITLLQINNDSNIRISTFLAIPERVGFAYPDTTIPEIIPKMGIASPGQSIYYDNIGTIEEVFETLPMDTLSIYYFPTDSIEESGWDYVRENNLMLKRDDLSRPVNEKWIIVYE